MIRTGIQYTLTGSGSVGSITINPTNYIGDGYYLKGIDAEVASSEGSVARTAADGTLLAPRYLSGVKVGIDLVLLGEASAATRQGYEDTLREIVGSMLTADGSLTWTPHDASAGRSFQKVRAITMPRKTGSDGPYLSMGFELETDRSHSESQTQTTTDSTALTASGSGLTFAMTFPISFTQSGGGAVTVPNAGNTDSYPILQIHGPISAPKITRVDTQAKLVLDTTIASGEYVEVDLFARSVKLNGSSSIRGVVDTSQSTWFSIPSGGTSVKVSGSGFDANSKLRSLSRDAWRV